MVKICDTLFAESLIVKRASIHVLFAICSNHGGNQAKQTELIYECLTRVEALIG